MKTRIFLSATILILSLSAAAQQKIHLPLKEAVAMVLEKSDEVGLANARVSTRQYELESVKNNRYPDVKISGQYLRLTNADINLRQANTSEDPNAEPAASPKVNQLALGQANVNMPVFSGFRLKNSINASKNLYKSETANAAFTKEETAMHVISLYADLYKVQKSVELYRESLKSGNQRVTDFKAMEQNGIIARNDLLQAQLQVSKIQLSLDEAEKNVRLINHYITTLLKLPAETMLEVSPEDIDSGLFSQTVKPESEALGSRKDLEALEHAAHAGQDNVKVAKSGYFPSLALVGGYTALDLQNFVTVRNAMNFGVGISYNLSSLFKNGKEVKVAESRVEELQQKQAILTDRIKTEIVKAQEDYDLSKKQDAVYKEAMEQAAENYRIVKDKYDNGLADTNDLLEADVEQLGANINLAYAKANVVLKFYELLDATGQLTQSFDLTK
ncbi:MAG TPA: TolC family protein [Flavobacterium sp.]|jgi:outer membrane protein TolC